MLDHPLTYVLAVLAGFVALIQGAERFVQGASTLARALGVSTLVIGLTIVALGTSAPEVFTSGAAALTNAPDIAIGNVIGSNIANVGLVLGVTALVAPLTLPRSLLREEIPILLIVSVVSVLLFLDGDLDWIDGVVLLFMLLAFLWRMFRNSRQSPELLPTDESEIQEYITDLSPLLATGLLVLGLVLMVAGSNVLVWGARNIAYTLGLSELVVGLTIVAIGTSLPELATSVTSVRKGHHDLAIGNVVGSNILNLLLVLPVPAFMATTPISDPVLFRDLPTMFFLTLLLAVLVFILLPTSKPLGKGSGAVFLLVYIAYTALLLVQKT